MVDGFFEQNLLLYKSMSFAQDRRVIIQVWEQAEYLQTCTGRRDRLAVILMAWRGGSSRLAVYFLAGGGRDKPGLYILAWGGRGRVCVVGVVVTHQSLFCFTGLEFLNHKVTQLAEERYSGTTLLFLLSQAGGYDGDWLPLLPQHGWWRSPCRRCACWSCSPWQRWQPWWGDQASLSN